MDIKNKNTLWLCQSCIDYYQVSDCVPEIDIGPAFVEICAKCGVEKRLYVVYLDQKKFEELFF